MLRSLLLVFLTALSFRLAAQQRPALPAGTEPLVIGQTFTLPSKALGETRRLNVYLPPAYFDSATLRLPVLYMPDGGLAEDFQHVAGLVQVLTGNGGMRPFILVGIENTQRRRDMTGPTTVEKDKKIAPKVGGSAVFRQFVRQELMPEINRRYRTTAEKAVVGESLAGLFVMETLLLEPDLFDTYLAFDPSLWWNNEYLVKQGATLLAKNTQPKTLYVASSNEPGIVEPLARMEKVLQGKAAQPLKWHYEKMPEETHGSIYHPAALRAFRAVFKPKS
jgi:predicted alpha/beta superfamily hydrolase